jgi:hypothetical protein
MSNKTTARLGCYDPTAHFRPQWAYPTPEGYRDETFIVGPFSLPVPGNGLLSHDLPVSVDDDVEYFIRAIMITTQIGTTGGQGTGVLARIRDTFGNPLSDGLVLGLGMWANQENGLNAFGWVMEPELQCSEGGVLLFDLQASSNGTAAFLLKSGTNETITFVAAVMGSAGNAFSIELINPGAANVPLSIAVVGDQVEVTLATNGASTITSTFAQVQAIINSTPAAAALMFALIAGTNPAEVITALALTSLAGGANGTPATYEGTFIGIKRFKECLT